MNRSKVSRWARIGRLGLLGAALAVVPGCSPNVTDKDISAIDMPELHRLMTERERNERIMVLIDPRSPRAFEEGHLPGAQNIRLQDVPEGESPIPWIQWYDNLVVYGDSAATPSARAMTKRLIANRYDNIRMFLGGMDEWVETGFELETGAAPPLPTDRDPSRSRVDDEG
ncbi:MAG: rhodanese-like domain-containing protein [Phycisphaerales bacterium]|nr:rhodanese-like domain-containing protein [Phycisphaerales bacterium]